MLPSNFRLMQGDCLERMKEIPPGSVDMILCDLPYGTTQNKWDAVIPFEPLWTEYWRVASPNAAVVLTAQCPFDKTLGASQVRHLKYEWIWEKPKATGHLNAKKQPMKAHENILVFCRGTGLYRPQKTPGKPYKGAGGGSKKDNYGDFDAVREGSSDGSRYPRSIQSFSHVHRPIHPTEKPASLFEYLIRTYTDEGMTVMDNCMGSGTAGVACAKSGRAFIGIERDEKYFALASDRIASCFPDLAPELAPEPDQLSLFA